MLLQALVLLEALLLLQALLLKLLAYLPPTSLAEEGSAAVLESAAKRQLQQLPGDGGRTSRS